MPELTQKEMETINHTLKQQDSHLKEIIWCLKGSAAMEIEGLIPAVKRMERDIRDIKDWRVEKNTLKNKIDLVTVAQVIGWVVAVTGGIFGILAFIL